MADNKKYVELLWAEKYDKYEKGERRKIMKFRKKPVVIEAIQWFKNGDHPEDNRGTFVGSDGKTFKGESKVVRYYRTSEFDGQDKCKQCGDIMHNHGWIDTLEGGHIVCPGDWIIKGVKGEFYPVKDDIFRETYEKLNV